ncbi:hypothetical protein DWB78_13400 [Halopelagius longus]|uniref:DUF7344 domain-containing protein n=1 Tax=Halopelagius longus TaxID=1236180 RepID=A0A370IPQ6_9EURY|nr:hypothetical protein DWB78_13400 [Halopelagius longus]
MLADARRRYALAYLRENDGEASFDELADAVATRERAERPAAASEDVALSLHHRHLPKLEQVGLTERTADVVSLTERGGSALETLPGAAADPADD